jgi:hypothetical protein
MTGTEWTSGDGRVNGKPLQAPFPYFGGKSGAADLVWDLIGPDVTNYVEPFLGSAAMLLARPGGAGKVETVNDKCGFIANFWRAVAADPETVAYWADSPVNETDLTARHGWLVNRAERLAWSLEDPDFYDAKVAGWWCWGACNWLGSGWCEGRGPWRSNGASVTDSRLADDDGDAGRGINRKLPHLGNAGQGINRKLPHLGDAGQGINRKQEGDRADFIIEWMQALSGRLRDVRVACGDWLRVAGSESVTTRHGVTGIFLDPPYTKGAMQYAAGGVGGDLASQVRDWCAANGGNPKLRIVLCGHAGEHDALLHLGWTAHQWTARKGYAQTDEAKGNSKGETVWASRGCVARAKQGALEL